MFKGLKTAVKRQRKLLVIFAITIFLPSVSLSIFGIIALRNEKFRIAQEIETEQVQIANRVKGNIVSRLKDSRERIENLTSLSSIRQKNYSIIKEQITVLSEEDSLVEITFLLFRNEEPVFPLFQAIPEEYGNRSVVIYNSSLQQQIKRAEDAEYVRGDYLLAASIYHNASVQSENNTIRARMLNHKARALMKAGKKSDAIDVYSNIINDFAEERTASGVPLELYAKIEQGEGYSLMGDKESAIMSDLNLFGELIENRWDLNESQFKTYASIVMDRLVDFMQENEEISSEYKSRFESLQTGYQHRIQQLQMISNIKSFIVPELAVYLEDYSKSSFPIQVSDRIGSENYLILTAEIPEQDRSDKAGLLAVKINNLYLRNIVLKNAVEKEVPKQNTSLCITTSSGDTITGDNRHASDAIVTTVLFDDNFPPWRLELSYLNPGNLGKTSIFANFFFWTILTLIVILVFGSILITRIIAHEMEILRIKSDFVSSVSHEFKTPLTSMKSLTERLKKGKVVQPIKLEQYISIISSDIDKLIRLVSNILNFSKIEEGKKVYHLEKTELPVWLNEVIHDFEKEGIERDLAMDIHLQIEEDIPALQMDREAMRQVLFNLLDNAVKFSDGNKNVEVSAEIIKNSLIIQVKDQGIGIDVDEKDKVFEKFYRGNSAIVHSIKGTGLGLAMARHIVEAHDGYIDLKQDPEWSTVLEIQLPLPDKK